MLRLVHWYTFDQLASPILLNQGLSEYFLNRTFHNSILVIDMVGVGNTKIKARVNNFDDDNLGVTMHARQSLLIVNWQLLSKLVKYTESKMDSHNSSALVSVFLKFWDFENLLKFPRIHIKRSQTMYYCRLFACNITKITLN